MCTYLLQTGALCDMGLVHWGIYAMGLLGGRQMERQAACKHHDDSVSSGFKLPLFFRPLFVLWLLIHSVRNAVQHVPRIMHTILYWCVFMWLDSGKLCPCPVGFSHRHKCNLTAVQVPSNRKNMGKRLTKCHQEHTDGLMQDCYNSIANAMELLQSCTKPLIWCNHDKIKQNKPMLWGISSMGNTMLSSCS